MLHNLTVIQYGFFRFNDNTMMFKYLLHKKIKYLETYNPIHCKNDNWHNLTGMDIMCSTNLTNSTNLVESWYTFKSWQQQLSRACVISAGMPRLLFLRSLLGRRGRPIPLGHWNVVVYGNLQGSLEELRPEPVVRSNWVNTKLSLLYICLLQLYHW